MALDSTTSSGNPVAILSIAPEAAFVANVKAALLKDSGVRGSLNQYGIGSNSYIVGGSVLTGVNYTGNTLVNMTIAGAASGQEIVFLVYPLGSKTPMVVKPTKLSNGKYSATLPIPCSWYAVANR